MSKDDALQQEIKQGRPFRSKAQEATVAILRTADVVRRRLAAVVEAHGITLQQHNVLRILRGARPGPLAAQEIGDRLIEQTPGVTRLLDRLEAKGWVRRERSSEDRRLVLTWITDSGMHLLSGMDAEVDLVDDAAVSGLDGEQMDQLLELLHRVRTDD